MKFLVIFLFLSSASSYAYQQKATKASIGRTLKRFAKVFNYCKRQHFSSSQRHLRGLIPLFFTVGKSGQVRRAGVGESRLPLSLKACLVEQVYRIPFAPPATRQDARVKFNVRI